MTVVYLVRHGESDWNSELRIQGHRDPALSRLGQRQAHAVAARLLDGTSWDALYTSDLVRAKQTAAVIAAHVGLSPSPKPRLRERGQGRLEGMTAADAVHAYPDFDAPEVGREPAADFGRRCVDALDDVVGRHPSGSVIVVTHGGVIVRLRLRFPMPAPLSGPIPPVNGSVSVLDTDGVRGKWRIYNDTDHLASADADTQQQHPLLTSLMDAG